MRIPVAEYHSLDLEAHTFLEGVPLHDVSAIDLPDGGPDRTLSDVRALLHSGSAVSPNALVRILFSIRMFVGRAFGWDRATHFREEESQLLRLTDDQRARSLVEPGTSEGLFRLLYAFPMEALSEVRNATVHAFSCMALRRTASGYRFYWAIYVRDVSRFTPIYMAFIEPVRRFVVYPSMLRRLRAAWVTAHASGTRRGAA